MNRIVPKDMSQREDKIVDWWVRYFQKEVPFKVTWNWKSEAYDTADGICYKDRHEVRFKRSVISRWLKQGRLDMIRNLVAHEMAHFLSKNSAHMSGKFAEYTKKWNFKG